MSKEDQIKIVKDLCDHLEFEIMAQIVNGKIPPEWDGLELRQLVSDHADNETRLRGKRLAEYQNTVLVENL